MRTTTIVAAVLAVSACSPRPGDVQPVDVTMACTGSVETARLEVERLSRLQDRAATGDAWGVLILGVPTSRLTGGNVASELAVAKGELAALEACDG